MVKMQVPDFMRKKPRQKRAEDTIDTIIEATAQVLHAEGEAGLSTNRIAERAGFGIGTLYQYFRDKDAILLAMAEKEHARIRLQVEALIKASDQQTPEENVRQVVRIVLGAFGGRPRVRRALVLLLYKRVDLMLMSKIISDIAATIFQALRWNQNFPDPPSPMRFAILTRAVMGATRGVLVENPQLLTTQEFEDELVALILAYLNAPRVKVAAPKATRP
jgi:AcrR family transcriptional regulator